MSCISNQSWLAIMLGSTSLEEPAWSTMAMDMQVSCFVSGIDWRRDAAFSDVQYAIALGSIGGAILLLLTAADVIARHNFRLFAFLSRTAAPLKASIRTKLLLPFRSGNPSACEESWQCMLFEMLDRRRRQGLSATLAIA